ncbi:MAG: hypothetical protein Q7S89_01740 [bacterium]|nr:hypothetical protein [bacterium]
MNRMVIAAFVAALFLVPSTASAQALSPGEYSCQQCPAPPGVVCCNPNPGPSHQIVNVDVPIQPVVDATTDAVIGVLDARDAARAAKAANAAASNAAAAASRAREAEARRLTVDTALELARIEAQSRKDLALIEAGKPDAALERMKLVMTLPPGRDLPLDLAMSGPRAVASKAGQGCRDVTSYEYTDPRAGSVAWTDAKDCGPPPPPPPSSEESADEGGHTMNVVGVVVGIVAMGVGVGLLAGAIDADHINSRPTTFAGGIGLIALGGAVAGVSVATW